MIMIILLVLLSQWPFSLSSVNSSISWISNCWIPPSDPSPLPIPSDSIQFHDFKGHRQANDSQLYVLSSYIQLWTHVSNHKLRVSTRVSVTVLHLDLSETELLSLYLFLLQGLPSQLSHAVLNFPDETPWSRPSLSPRSIHQQILPVLPLKHKQNLTFHDLYHYGSISSHLYLSPGLK